MNKLLATFVLTLSMAGSMLAQSFEGTIEFKKQTQFDTTTYIYYVSGDKVRLDEIGSKSKKPEGTFLVNLNENKMISINHNLHKYLIRTSTTPSGAPAGCEANETKLSKTLLGYKCTETVVSNAADGVKIAFYMAAGKFDFFGKFMKILNRKDKFYTYYLKLNPATGTFPFLAIQTNTDGKETSRLEVTKVEKKKIDASLFEIPDKYLLFDDKK